MVRADGSNTMPREHRAALDEMREAFGNLLMPVIPDRAAVKQCAGFSRTLFEFDPDNTAAQVYLQVAKTIRSATQ
jgi:cellulose biosynthesis protein BcsQ